MHLPKVLALDVSGYPSHWMSYEEYAAAFCKDGIAWAFGEDTFTLRGGISRMTGEQSKIGMSSIVAVRGLKVTSGRGKLRAPGKVAKFELFRRDHHMCAYCGRVFEDSALEVEHVKPASKGGPTSWTNLVTACRPCNNFKSDRTPEQAGMELLYVPYEPNRAEWLILANRTILQDQMEYLLSRCPEHSRAHLHKPQILEAA